MFKATPTIGQPVAARTVVAHCLFLPPRLLAALLLPLDWMASILPMSLFSLVDVNAIPCIESAKVVLMKGPAVLELVVCIPFVIY